MPSSPTNEQPLQLTKTFSQESYRQALEDWAWLPVEGKHPFLTSLFGDVFLQDGAGIWRLDVLEGNLSLVFSDGRHMIDALNTEEGQDEHLLGGLALAANRHRGLTPGPDDVLAWTVPPILGGPLTIENLQVMSFVVYASIQGQLHRQVKDLPPGTRISGLSVDGQVP